MQPFYTTRGGAAPLFIICGVSRHHHPLNLLNPLNPLNLHTEGVSNEPSHRRCVQGRLCPGFHAHKSIDI